MVRWLAPTLLGLALACGCGDSGQRPSNASETETSADEAEPEQEPTEPPPLPEEPPPPPEPAAAQKDVEDMTEAELEAACFDGNQAACDRLGH